MDVLGELAKAIEEGRIGSREELERLKRELAAKEHLPTVPSDADVLGRLGDRASPWAIDLLRTKPSRSLSGVAVIAIMTPPAPCPHGRCAYCPGGVEVGTPQSYTGKEPAARRGSRWDFDASHQTSDRLGQLAQTGHATDKVELVVMGGTFPAIGEPARSAFVKGAIEALNGHPSPSLEEAIDSNERGAHRCVALTVETRPDLCGRKDVDDLLALGTTRVEIGVQTVNDRPLELVGRGHGARESLEATHNLKDAGLKVGYHLMLGLPGMTPKDDQRALDRIVDDPAFRPDLLKLYPTLVMPDTPLHQWWREGKYEPLDEEGAVELLAHMKARIPSWIRISRVERDIPSNLIAAGVRASNLRQLVASRLDADGLRCRCIRCREVGRKGIHRVGGGGAPREAPDPDSVELREESYEASGGEESFLSLELPDEDAIVGYARLRRPSEGSWRRELDGAAILREVRVLGEALPLGSNASDRSGSLGWQHRGLGRRLVHEAEERVVLWEMDLLAIMAGMGTRDYFRKMGYRLSGPYMVKQMT
jgi:elongator complex protein 3